MKKFIYGSCIILLLAACNNKNRSSDAYGNFEATEIIVSAQHGGQILWLNVDEGSTLKADEQIGLIDTSDLYLQKQLFIAQKTAVQAQYPILKAQADVQRQQFTNLEKDFNRIKNMLKDGATTQKQYDDIEGGMAIAKRQIAAIESQQAALHSQQQTIDKQIAQVENTIKKCKIVNPQEGTVLVKYAETGETTAPTKAIYKIGNLAEMKLKIYVSETQLSSIKIGQKVSMLIDSKNKNLETLEGEIAWISDKAEFTPKIIQTREERVNLVYAVKVAVKNDGRLKIGMPAEVNFQ